MTIEGGPSGQTIERFKSFERFGHWCLAGSFIMLACTGLLLLFGRSVIIPIFGHEANSAIAFCRKILAGFGRIYDHKGLDGESSFGTAI